MKKNIYQNSIPPKIWMCNQDRFSLTLYIFRKLAEERSGEYVQKKKKKNNVRERENIMQVIFLKTWLSLDSLMFLYSYNFISLFKL